MGADNMHLFPSKLFKFISKQLIRADIFSFLILYLMGLLIIGTLFQKQIGVYQAENLFFSSYWILVMGVFPIPGTKTILAFILISLLFRLGLERWKIQKIGSLLLHSGVVLLLFGGFISSFLKQEGAMVIKKGESVDYMQDYHSYELVIIDPSNQDGIETIISFDQSQLKKNRVLHTDYFPFQIKIEQFFKNVSLVKNTRINQQAYGVRRLYHLKKEPLEKINEENRAGLLFSVSRQDKLNLSDYLIIENLEFPQYIHAQNKRYQIILRHKRTYLPFSIKLLEFRYMNHPGTRLAKHYQSDLLIEDQNTSLWKTSIKMNQPVRYKGYTLYQSSFEETQTQTTTILAIVYNKVRLFPYISGLIMMVGILWHILQKRRLRIQIFKKTRKEKI